MKSLFVCIPDLFGYTYGGPLFQFWSAYVSLGYQYFWNDKRAYSIRAVPQRNTPSTLSLSTLQVLNIGDGLSFLFEVGRLGVNYPVPFSHYGASVNVGNDNWYVQFGFTVSKSLKEIEYHVDQDGRMYWSGDSQDINRYGVVSIAHPEIQIQFSL